MVDIKKRIFKLELNETQVRRKYPWVGTRPILIPKGWFGLLNNACKEIEIAVSPSKTSEAVNYFFATVRDSRLKIFIDIEPTKISLACKEAIQSLLNDTQNISIYTCSICGAKVEEFRGRRSINSGLTICSIHDKVINQSSEEKDKDKQITVNKSVNVENALKEIFLEADTIEIVDEIQSNDNDSLNHKLYDTNDIKKLIKEASLKYRDKDDERKVCKLLENLIQAGQNRDLKPFPLDGDSSLNQLSEQFPNFVDVINMLRGVNALANNNEAPKIPPILLLGAPGVGKTMFAESLADVMGVPFKVVRMENQQAGAGLVGTADYWSNTKPGIVFNLLTSGNCANPIIVVDEVDKVISDNRHNPLNGMYSLLEKNSAKSFTDESMPDIHIDASKITWILTANDKKQIPEPILSRLVVFEIQSPDKKQAANIAINIYNKLINESPSIKSRFNNGLSEDVIALLSDLSPRKMKLAIEMAFGKAAVAKKDRISCEEFNIQQKNKIRKIGFIH